MARRVYSEEFKESTVQLVLNSEDILWVSNILGHADASMILRMYAKYRKREDIKRATFLENKSVPKDTETTPKSDKVG